MAIDFPSSPTTNQQYTYSGVTYVFTAEGVWVTGGSGGFSAATTMIFQQAAAPTGWTKQTTHNDKALRIVSGTPSSGGTVAFSTVFGKTATDALTLALTQIPAHYHLSNNPQFTGTDADLYSIDPGVGGYNFYRSGYFSNSTQYAGSTLSHQHGLDIRVQYVDVIIASKN